MLHFTIIFYLKFRHCILSFLYSDFYVCLDASLGLCCFGGLCFKVGWCVECPVLLCLGINGFQLCIKLIRLVSLLLLQLFDLTFTTNQNVFAQCTFTVSSHTGTFSNVTLRYT